jgi:hypothetical protein
MQALSEVKAMTTLIFLALWGPLHARSPFQLTGALRTAWYRGQPYAQWFASCDAEGHGWLREGGVLVERPRVCDLARYEEAKGIRGDAFDGGRFEAAVRGLVKP